MSINSGASVAGSKDVTVTANVSDAVEMRLSPPMRQVSSAGSHAIGIATDGTLWAWGRNHANQAGGTAFGTYSPTAVRVSADTTWRQISAGGSFNIGIKEDGTLWAWGMSDGTGNGGPAVPTQVGTATDWKDVSAGQWHSVAVKTNGTLWATGYNANGQLGNGTTNGSSTFVQIGTATDWASVKAGGNCSYAIKTGGTLWGWGYNVQGNLGIGHMNVAYSPAQVGTATDWASATGGFGIKTNGTLWGWGPLNSGALSPVQVGVDADWAQVSGGTSTLARKTDGSLWTWGPNNYGGCGLGHTTPVPTPTRVGVATGWTDVCSGGGSTFALLDGDLYDAGLNTYAQLGDGTQTQQTTFTRIGLWEPYVATRPWKIIADSATGVAGLFVTYRDAGGETLLLSDTINYDLSVPSGTMNLDSNATSTRSQTVRVISSMSYANEMRIDSGPWTPYSQFATATIGPGDGTKTVAVEYRYSTNGNTTTKTDTIDLDTQAPTGIMSINEGRALSRFARVSVNSSVDGAVGLASRTETWTTIDVGYPVGGTTTLGIKSDGSLWGWGSGGLLGQGLTSQQAWPIEISPGTAWKQISTVSSHVVALRTDGSLWAWGTNDYGQIGDGTNLARSVPQRIGSSLWRSVAAGYGYTLGVKQDGTLWAWGKNDLYQLGDGTIVGKTSAVRVGTDTDWSEVYSGGNTSYALKTDGTLWAWGYNGSGQVGDGLTANRTAPFKIGTATDWALISPGSSAVLALKTDGTLWAWGSNSNYEYGNGVTTASLTPARVGTAMDWANVSLNSSVGMGVKSDGSLWTWGYNANGTIGDGTYGASRPLPTKILDAGMAAKAFGVNVTSFALTPGGALLGWGYNAYGQIGNLGIDPRYTPGPAALTPYSSTFVDTLSSGNGTRAATIDYVDAAGNILTLTDDIVVDSAASPGTFQIAGGAPFVTSTTVSIDSDIPGSAQMRIGQRPISIDGGTEDTFGYASPSLLLLDDGPLMKTVAETTFTPIAQPTGDWVQGGTGTGNFLLAADGTVYAWGSNGKGELGVNDTVARTAPTPVWGSYRFRKFATGSGHVMGLATDGRMYGWGFDDSGQAGVGYTLSIFGNQIMWPTGVVGGHSDWTDVAARADWSAGIRSGGTLWYWGLQPGSSSKRSSPVQVGTATGYAKVSLGTDHLLVIKQNGSLWAWGDNASGQLGDGTTVAKAADPVLVDGGEWRCVTGGTDFSVGIRADGSLWAWGLNSYGQLGKGDTSNSTVPVRIGTSRDWETVEAGASWVYATKKDGSVWAWGRNNHGQLGLGDTANRSVPTEVPMRPLVPYATSSTASVPWAGSVVNIWASFLDAAGNVTWLSDSTAFDLAEPHTTITALPVTWVAAPVTFELDATDESSGVDKIFYRIDGGAAQEYAGPVTVSKQGLTDLEYWATDQSGHVEQKHTGLIRIDGSVSQTMPTTTPCATCHTGFPAAHPFANCVSCHYGAFGHFSLGRDEAPVGYCWSGSYCHSSPPFQVHGAEEFSAPDTYYDWNYDCTYCHATRFPDVRSHVEPDLLHVSDTPAQECRPCHSAVLTREHSRYVDTLGDPLTCMTCHSASAPAAVVAAVGADDSRCESCHGAAGDHSAFHAGAPLGAECLGCHSDDLLIEHITDHGLGCSACHASSESRVQTAIAGNDKACSACHLPGHPHPAAQITGVLANGQKECTACHSTDLVIEHSKSTSQSMGSSCETCHVEGGARDQITGVWDGRCDTAACHAAGGARAVHDNYCYACHAVDQPDFATSKTSFVVGSEVDRDTACKACHLPGFAGAHPYHQIGSNCGAACHLGWGNSSPAATPVDTDPISGAAFASSESKDASPDILHAIHSRASWPASARPPTGGSAYVDACDSCHAVAACNACHAAAIPIQHSGHSSSDQVANPAWAGVVGRGVVGGDQTQQTAITSSSQCASAGCHAPAVMAERRSRIVEDFNHGVGGNPDDRTVSNTAINLIGTWRTRYSVRYTGGRMSYSNSSATTLTASFTGISVEILSERDPYRGIASVTIDGVAVGTFDAYAPVSQPQAAVFSADLEAGTHVIAVHPLGTKSDSARGAFVVVDGFRVLPQTSSSIVPACVDCHLARVATHW